MISLSKPLQGKGGVDTGVNPSPPATKDSELSDETFFAKLDMSVIRGMKGTNTPTQTQARWMYLMRFLFSHERALMGNPIFQKSAAAIINHHSATESELYT